MKFFVELIIELALSVGTNKNLSRWVRYPILLLVGSLFAAIVGSVAALGVAQLRQGNPLPAAALFFLALGLLVGIGYLFYTRYQQHKAE